MHSLRDSHQRARRLARAREEQENTQRKDRDGEGDAEAGDPWSIEALGWGDQPGIHVVVRWQHDSSPAYGQEHLVRVAVRPEPSITLGTPSRNNGARTCPLTMTCGYPVQVIRHSFVRRGPCVVPICVRVTNAAPPGSDPLPYVFEVMDPLRPPVSKPLFFWAGTTTATFADPGLLPGDRTSLSLTVVFPQPGVYDVNRFGFRLTFDEKTGATIAPAKTRGSAAVVGKRELQNNGHVPTVTPAGGGTNQLFVFPENSYWVRVVDRG